MHDVRFRCRRFKVCELSELLFKHVFDGLWHGGFVRLVKDIRCDLVDGNAGDLIMEDPERIQLRDVLEDRHNLRREHMGVPVIFVVGLYDEVLGVHS